MRRPLSALLNQKGFITEFTRTLRKQGRIFFGILNVFTIDKGNMRQSETLPQQHFKRNATKSQKWLDGRQSFYAAKASWQ